MGEIAVQQTNPNETRVVSAVAQDMIGRSDFFELDIEQQIARATVFANALKKIVDSQNLAVKFGTNQEYLPVEVWQTLGSFLGVTPREKEVKKHEDGSFEAKVDLVRLATGMVIGSGSGYCGMDESTWKNKPAFSRRSMAITRGTGKAYRTAFSWIMVLAGYAPTPVEEMPVTVEVVPTKKPYDAQDETQQNALIEVLKGQKIDAVAWPTISDRLQGKFSKDLPSIIKTVMKELSNEQEVAIEH